MTQTALFRLAGYLLEHWTSFRAIMVTDFPSWARCEDHHRDGGELTLSVQEVEQAIGADMVRQLTVAPGIHTIASATSYTTALKEQHEQDIVDGV